MDLVTFNELAVQQAAEVLRPCADVDSWITDVVAGRPYASVAELLAGADVAAAGWGSADVDAALAQHPRIGERRSGDDVEAAFSSKEQAGISGDEQAIAAGNRAYEERFGRIFLIRAAGRTSSEVLDQLHERLENDPETEVAVVAGQLREIALLRLEGIFS